MRAIVMAAGLGTRLRPLTDQLPKPLVPLLGRPMVEYVLDLLAQHGISEALINIHYLPDKMRAFVDAWNLAGKKPLLRIQDESARILGSGGALVKGASWLFEKEPFALVCNADVIACPDLSALLDTHSRLRKNGVEGTLAAMPHQDAGVKYNGLKVEGEKVLGFEWPGVHSNNLFHFPGFYVVDEKSSRLFPKEGQDFSVVDKIWTPLAAEGKLGAFLYDGYYLDLGTVADLRAAEDFLGRD